MTADGEDCARLDLDLEQSVRFDLASHVEVIEVWAEDDIGRFSLVSLLLPFDAESGRQQAFEATRHLPDSSQQLLFEVVPRSTAGSEELSEIVVSYCDHQSKDGM